MVLGSYSVQLVRAWQFLAPRRASTCEGGQARSGAAIMTPSTGAVLALGVMDSAAGVGRSCVLCAPRQTHARGDAPEVRKPSQTGAEITLGDQ